MSFGLATGSVGAIAQSVAPGVFAFVSRAADAMVSGMIVSCGRALLVDPGVLPDEIEALAEFAERQGAVVEALFLTHHHWDHVLATARWPGARRLAHPALEAIVRNQQREAEYRKMLLQTCSSHGCPPHEDWELLAITDPLHDGQRVDVGEVSCETLLLSGHAPDAAGLLVIGERVLFTADMLDPNELPLPDHDLDCYLASLDRIEKLLDDGRVERIVPGHGWPLLSPAEIRSQLARDRSYLLALPR
ncbi:MAG: MBL fold metallo-hydrolase [Candidatus Wallbacteria bacterium]|nr:MBL fold metallo-hydrolase [Candidatus Wallbacteria bacterium]